MSFNFLNLSLLNQNDWKILKDLFFYEPDCAKFISRRLNLDLKETMERLKILENLKLIKRIEATFIKKGKKLKHRNHTYYEIDKEFKKWLKRELFKEGE
ncbi:MAG: DUF2250 domain-containing protein [Thermodesulfobacteriaceae bacterium]|nr:DUF2250 domain-containing protein [Thermodesulfobacteriaceae bacterium]MCX8042108.1 DUF2250 domain-containing protein [Thermodesulfobacteriaceae bacterium]MDW8136204.1 DUF2250 domain-containing protein [Thermodesulfobacterium sp.]